uniref:uncharacterized protein LOC120347912 n=1 Tax=Styela clava TaxID=7725 RepID=UPI001939580D|nr:uncharacterized protein LOC120347912 [Styela clava]
MGLRAHKVLLITAALLLGLYLIGRTFQRIQKRIESGTPERYKIYRSQLDHNSTTYQAEGSMKFRREMMLSACRKYSKNRPSSSEETYVKNPFLKTSLFFSDEFKVLFCQIPKCATRSQAKFLAAADDLIKESEMDTVTEIRATSLIHRKTSFCKTHTKYRRDCSKNDFTDNAKVQKYFADVSPILVESLYQTYKKDYELFGFMKPSEFQR